MHYLFILGASDPEMSAIEAVLSAAEQPYAFAAVGGKRCHPGNACKADSIIDRDGDFVRPFGGGTLVWVECKAPGYGRHIVVDHHNDGDPGFGRPPAEYIDASSLGQVLSLLVIPPTLEQCIIAAADHCLGAAYAGKCPGVDPAELKAWRIRSRAAFQRRPEADVAADIEAAVKTISAAPVTCLLGVEDMPHTYEHDWSRSVCEGCASDPVTVRDLRGRKVAELPDAQAITGLSVLCDGLPGPDGRRKINVMGSEDACRAFLNHWAERNEVVDTYGDPSRGIVGGYL